MTFNPQCVNPQEIESITKQSSTKLAMNVGVPTLPILSNLPNTSAASPAEICQWNPRSALHVSSCILLSMSFSLHTFASPERL